MRRPWLALALLAALGSVVWLNAQRARPLEGYDAEPGGTPEDRLWEVLVLMGASDREPASWNGRAQVTSGELLQMEPYRFDLPDRILPDGGWRLQTRVERVLYGHGKAPEQHLLPKGVLLRGSGTAATRVLVSTASGSCEFTAFSPEPCPGGRIQVTRVPATTDLSGTELRQHDLPAITASQNATLWATWLSYHDKQEELNFRRYRDGKWTRLIPVPRAAADLWRPNIVTDASNTPWLIWSQQTSGNWDIWAMPWVDDDWGAAVRISRGALPDIEPHVARAPDGTIYVVWQAMEARVSHIFLAYHRQGRWSEPMAVTGTAANDWDPSVAAGPDNRAWIAWDRYNTSYDIYARSYSPSTGFTPEVRVAGSPALEAYASVAVDGNSRPWIAFETGGANWGKDVGPLSPSQPGSPLGDRRGISVVALDGGEWKAAPALAPSDALEAGSSSHSRPLLHVDNSGSLWMAFKRRYSRTARNASTHWESFVTRLEGSRWSTPVMLPQSASRNSTRMGIASAAGRLWLFYSNENRRYEFMSRPRLHRVVAASLPLPGTAPAPVLSARSEQQEPLAPTAESRDIQAIRNHRVKLGKESLRIVRGDLHRHTEFSQDQGGMNDGSLPEFYRYIIDASGMDFGASTDHQAGGIDYWAFLTLKFADMFHFPERFVPLYAYERNLGFPHGHRNIVHIQRNYPIVPFFQRPTDRFLLPDAPDGELLTFNSNSYGGGVLNDTKLLYEELRKSGGLAIPHTSGSAGMGTDWRDNDPQREPLVEIYQGDRYNYEEPEAPRGIALQGKSQKIDGVQEAGMVWNAWKKGYKIGVISSSDHFSTHISYAMVYTQRQERQAIFESMLARHAYGATDNIILEFWMGNHFMGDAFRASKKEPVRIKVIGTGPVETVHLIRDGQYIHKAQPRTREVNLEYRDQEAGPGEHWYYVRVEQANGELAWSSPIWVTY